MYIFLMCLQYIIFKIKFILNFTIFSYIILYIILYFVNYNKLIYYVGIIKKEI